MSIDEATEAEVQKQLTLLIVSPIDKQIQKLLLKHKKTLSVAESCSGGQLSFEFTKVPGASEYYAGGVCTYNNYIKNHILKVQRSTLKKHTAVSQQTAMEMAASVRCMFETSIGLSTTGYAGPSGDNVGLVWIAIDGLGNKIQKKFNFKGVRWQVQLNAAMEAKKLLLQELKKYNKSLKKPKLINNKNYCKDCSNDYDDKQMCKFCKDGSHQTLIK